MTHKEWLDNEYNAWIAALQESTADNFKDQPVVQRMLGSVAPTLPFDRPESPTLYTRLTMLDCVGRREPGRASGDCWRMYHYAKRVLACRPQRIVEIGAGVGQFFATLNLLGYEGTYFIYDLPAVQAFQARYLAAAGWVISQSLRLTDKFHGGEFCCSFYALGEFDDETKRWYLENIVSRCPHGLVIWNPHSGASSDINWPWPCEITDEEPLTHEGNKQITW